MIHDPTLESSGPKHWWFECSCGWMGDTRWNVYSASVRWQAHMDDVIHAQIRDAVERGPKER